MPDPPIAERKHASKWRRLPGLRLFTERWFAWRNSRELLDLYRRVQVETPGLTAHSLYERVVMRWRGLGENAARSALRRAEQSFCEWPADRDLTFRDVVLYLVIEEYLGSHSGTHTNFESVVLRVIPANF